MTGSDSPEGQRPEPVTNAAKLAGAIAAVVLAVGGLLRAVDLLPVGVDVEDLAQRASDAVLAVGVAWAVVGPWVTARIGARDKVTPLADPRDAIGNPLYSDALADLIQRFPAFADEARDKLQAGLTFDVVYDYLETLEQRRARAGRRAATGATAAGSSR